MFKVESLKFKALLFRNVKVAQEPMNIGIHFKP
jgi:hypothetical protein